MTETRTANSSARGELLHVIRAIQNLSLEVAQLRHEDHGGPELEAKEHTLEQLRWRLAAVARRHATGDSGAAA